MFKESEKKIKLYKEEINSASMEIAKLEGSLESIVKDLKEEFKITTKEEAQKLLEEFNGKKTKYLMELEEKIEKLESLYAL